MKHLKFEFHTRVASNWIIEELEKAKNIIEQSPYLTVDFIVVINRKKPEVVNERITEEWFQKYITNNLPFSYEGALFHVSDYEGKILGLEDGLRGVHFNDDDIIAEMWVRASKGDMIRFTDGSKRSKLAKVVAHEIGHHLKKVGVTELDIHKYDYKNRINNIEKFYRQITGPKTGLLRVVLIALVKKLMAALAARNTTLVSRVPVQYKDAITQGYGVKNSAYELTGRHIGVDWAMPIGTPCFAPFDGEVTVVGTHASLGNFCYFEYEFQGKKRVERYMHLDRVPVKRKVKRGTIVGYSGNTGFSTGPHLHVDGWWGEVNIGKINKSNWSELTYNPII